MYGVFDRALFTILQNVMILGDQIDLPRGSKFSDLVHSCETIWSIVLCLIMYNALNEICCTTRLIQINPFDRLRLILFYHLDLRKLRFFVF